MISFCLFLFYVIILIVIVIFILNLITLKLNFIRHCFCLEYFLAFFIFILYKFHFFIKLTILVLKWIWWILRFLLCFLFLKKFVQFFWNTILINHLLVVFELAIRYILQLNFIFTIM